MTFMCKSANGSWHVTIKRLEIVHVVCKSPVFFFAAVAVGPQEEVLTIQRSGLWEK